MGYFSTFGTQRGGNDFNAFWAEFEYGATAWWTIQLALKASTNRFNFCDFEHVLCGSPHCGQSGQIMKTIAIQEKAE